MDYALIDEVVILGSEESLSWQLCRTPSIASVPEESATVRAFVKIIYEFDA